MLTKFIKKMPKFLQVIAIDTIYFLEYLFQKKPQVVFIEPTNLCNYDCVICPRTNMKRKLGFMDYNFFKKIIDDLSKNGIRRVFLQGYGEPLLHPRIMDMVRYVKSKGLYAHFDTNTYLLNKQKSKEIIESGLDRIKFSFHGITRDSYKKIMGRDEFEEAIKKINDFNNLKKRLRSEKPETVLQFAVTDITLKNMGKIYDIFKGKVDKINIVTCSWCSGYSKEIHSLTEPTKRIVPCFNIIDSLIIFWDGTVTVCCADFDGFLRVGDIKQGFKKILSSKALKEIKRNHLKRNFNSFCANCIDEIESYRTEKLWK